MHTKISLACLIIAAFGMGLFMVYTEGPRFMRFVTFTTLFVAAITCGIIIGMLASAG